MNINQKLFSIAGALNYLGRKDNITERAILIKELSENQIPIDGTDNFGETHRGGFYFVNYNLVASNPDKEFDFIEYPEPKKGEITLNFQVALDNCAFSIDSLKRIKSIPEPKDYTFKLNHNDNSIEFESKTYHVSESQFKVKSYLYKEYKKRNFDYIPTEIIFSGANLDPNLQMGQVSRLFSDEHVKKCRNEILDNKRGSGWRLILCKFSDPK